MIRRSWFSAPGTALALALILLAGSSAFATSVAIDIDPPSVTVLTPEDGATVSGKALIDVAADDGLGSGIDVVEYQIDSVTGPWQPLALNLISLTYREYWDTTVWADGSHNLYVRATDNAGNETTVYVVVRVANPPVAPTGLGVTEPSPPSNGGYLDMYWNPNGEGDLAGYNVYRSTASGGPYAKVAGVSTNAYRDTGLANGTTYFYVVSAVDAAGNESRLSAEAFGTPQDTRAPGMSTVSAGKITPYQAEITWTTDEPATGQVEYGTSTALGLTAGGDAAPTAAHAVLLTGLQPGATYYFRARSADAAGNEATSDILSFITPADSAPSVTLESPAEGAVLAGTVEIKATANDDWGLAAVEYSRNGGAFQPMAFSADTGHWTAGLDTAALADGRHTITARATDDAGQSASASAEVIVDNQAPAVEMVSPELEAHLLGGAVHTWQVAASDAGAGLAAVDWQIYEVPPGVELEEAPAPDPDLWQPMALNADTGYYEAAWQSPVVVTEQIAYVYAQAADATGKRTLVSREAAVMANGREFELIGSGGEEIFGMVAVEPIGTTDPYRIGIEVRGRSLAPGATYQLTVSGEGVSYTVSLTADDRGRGEAVFESDTTMTDEFAAAITVSGPGY